MLNKKSKWDIIHKAFICAKAKYYSSLLVMIQAIRNSEVNQWQKKQYRLSVRLK
jgi:hypothetical protein